MYVGLRYGSVESSSADKWDFDEADPITISLADPRELVNVESDREIEEILERWSGCEEVRIARERKGCINIRQ